MSLILDIIIGGLLTGGIFGLLAVGFNLQYGVVRVLNLSHGEFIMVGAFGTYLLYVSFEIGPFVSLAICGPVLFIIGFLLHKVLFERLRKKSKSMGEFEGSSMLVSFGLLFITQNTVLLLCGPDQRGYSYLANPVNLFGAIFAENRLIVFLFAVVLALTFYLFLLRTRLGKGIRAAGQEATSAELVGINMRWMHGLCFAFGALLAGLAGTLISSMYLISPFIGFQYTITAIIVVVLGGLGNIMGSLAAGFILGIVSTIVLYVKPSLESVVFYGLFMLIILVRPKGIFGR